VHENSSGRITAAECGGCRVLLAIYRLRLKRVVNHGQVVLVFRVEDYRGTLPDFFLASSAAPLWLYCWDVV
jgi:hypothetical protein